VPIVKNRPVVVMVVTLALGLAGIAFAQSPDYRIVESPFQEDLDYEIGTDLRPRVEIDGVRWTRFAIQPKEGKEIVADKAMPVTIELEFANQTSKGARLLVIILFEDASGNPLDRIECKPVKAGGDRLKESIQKFKIEGNVLLRTRKVYLFCEVEF
ncbi:MAG: hypothetical protein ACC742_07225, partial [Thermoanaerobaculales bacterium]